MRLYHLYPYVIHISTIPGSNKLCNPSSSLEPELEPTMGHPWDTPGTGTSWLVVLQDGRTELAEAIASTEGVRVGHATWTKGATFTATGI